MRSYLITNLLSRQIAFVANEEFVNVFARVTIYFLQPLLDIVKRLLVRHIVGNDDPMCSSVVGRGDRPEAFLASSVPYLQLYHFTVEFDCSNFLETKASDQTSSDGFDSWRSSLYRDKTHT